MLSFAEIARVVHGEVIQSPYSGLVQHLLLDSRKIVAAESSLFFAIAGERHNGHRYLTYLYEKGVRHFVVEQSGVDLQAMQSANVLIVKSSVAALQALAAHHRAQFHYPVVAITGSNGKTIVKEWLAQLLFSLYQIVRSPRSYNSQVGVPLSVWVMQEQHQLGIFEAGISRPGEMELLEKIIQPTIGIFTNIGTAHEEGFASISKKIDEKLQLFKGIKTLIYCADHAMIAERIGLMLPGQQTFLWSLKGNVAAVQFSVISRQVTSTWVQMEVGVQRENLLVPFADEASLQNVLHCIAFMFFLKIEVSTIAQRLAYLQPIAMRLELKQGIRGTYLIDDSYNNDLVGLAIAIGFLAQQNQAANKSLILSDMLESAMAPELLYQRVAAMVKATGIHKIIGIGATISQYLHLFENAVCYPDTDSFLEKNSEYQFQDEIILIKGARVFQFEKIVQALQEKAHGTVLEVNLDALACNLNYFKSLLQPSTKVMVMVKAFAYGSGSYEVANLLQFHRVDYLGVAYTDEGADLRTHGISLPIMVMNPSASSFAKIQAHRLEPEIYSFKILNEYLSFLSRGKFKQAKIHLKIDTGMHRLGFQERDVDALIELLSQNPQLYVASVFTHLAGADEALHDDYSIKQFTLFSRIAACIESALGHATIKHVLNSAGIVRFAAHQHDMVRLGIGLYGVDATSHQQEKLQTVGTLKTVISQIKMVEPGDTIGYSRKGVVIKTMRIATIAIGYADGYDRRFSRGVGKVSVNGVLCSVIGNVCMDMVMIDITEASAEEGDEVEIFGKNISILSMAKSIDTIPYEILTNVSGRVKRVFYSE